MKNGTNAQDMILPAQATDATASKPRKRPVVSTTALIAGLIQTLDAAQFLRDLQELDAVTRRQCLMRAQRDLSQSGAIRLHGSRAVRKVIKRLQAEDKS